MTEDFQEKINELNNKHFNEVNKIKSELSNEIDKFKNENNELNYNLEKVVKMNTENSKHLNEKLSLLNEN